jgi:hypothetical protein
MSFAVSPGVIPVITPGDPVCEVNLPGKTAYIWGYSVPGSPGVFVPVTAMGLIVAASRVHDTISVTMIIDNKIPVTL